MKAFIIDSAQTALDKGTDLSGYTWITIDNGVVTDIDFAAYLAYVRRMKPAPAFDGIYNPSWENSLFGTATVDNQHFTQYSFATPYGTWDAPLADWGDCEDDEPHVLHRRQQNHDFPLLAHPARWHRRGYGSTNPRHAGHKADQHRP